MGRNQPTFINAPSTRTGEHHTVGIIHVRLILIFQINLVGHLFDAHHLDHFQVNRFVWVFLLDFSVLSLIYIKYDLAPVFTKGLIK